MKREVLVKQTVDPAFDLVRSTLQFFFFVIYRTKRYPGQQRRRMHCGLSLGHFIKNETTLGKEPIEKAMEGQAVLRGRTWRNVKDAIRNIILREQ